MKSLIIFLISFNCLAGHYLPESKLGKSTDGVTLYKNKVKCESVYFPENCYSVRVIGNMPFHELKPDTQLKEQSESCADEADCIAKYDALDCTNDGFYKIRTAENDEVYCTKFQAAHIVEDPTKKSDYMAKQLKKSNRQAKIAKGKERRAKCESFLSYISGEFSSADEATVDALTTQFAPIISAANGCKMKKLNRLLGEITDPAYADLKAESLEILK